jgi:hypothetical protein
MSGALFYSTIIGAFLKRESFARDKDDFFALSSYRLRAHEYDRAFEILDEVEAGPDRNARWYLLRAVARLGRGEKDEAIADAKTAVDIMRPMGHTHDPYALLCMAAGDVRFPEDRLAEVYSSWMLSKECTDENLWLVTLSLGQWSQQIIDSASANVKAEAYPLTSTWLLMLSERFDEARGILRQDRTTDPESTFAHLYLDYLLETRLPGGDAQLAKWLEAHFAALSEVAKNLQSEDVVRVAYGMAYDCLRRSRQLGLQWAAKLEDVEARLLRRYESAPGFVPPKLLPHMVRINAALTHS